MVSALSGAFIDGDSLPVSSFVEVIPSLVCVIMESGGYIFVLFVGIRVKDNDNMINEVVCEGICEVCNVVYLWISCSCPYGKFNIRPRLARGLLWSGVYDDGVTS